MADEVDPQAVLGLMEMGLSDDEARACLKVRLPFLELVGIR